MIVFHHFLRLKSCASRKNFKGENESEHDYIRYAHHGSNHNPGPPIYKRTLFALLLSAQLTAAKRAATAGPGSNGKDQSLSFPGRAGSRL